MSELRQDPTTYDWIVIARDRAKRSHQFTGDQKAVDPNPEFRKQCPFCPGDEHMSPPAVMICGEDDNWRLRVVSNKFPALTPVGDVTRDERKIFRSCHGYGRHEVIVESPRQNDSIPLQMADGVGGILVEGVDECAAAMCDLLNDSGRAMALGKAGRERVREHFLMPRLVLNHLELMRNLVNGERLTRESGWLRSHDPVCGMALGENPEATTRHQGTEYGFCSARCRRIFFGRPEHYTRQNNKTG
ncbi:MAG: YHS domain-containing protein [Desulfobulbaceae bacterium]|nr:YHS domain-containing protein [Desulfobulbaceae bacterium]